MIPPFQWTATVETCRYVFRDMAQRRSEVVAVSPEYQPWSKGEECKRLSQSPSPSVLFVDLERFCVYSSVNNLRIQRVVSAWEEKPMRKSRAFPVTIGVFVSLVYFTVLLPESLAQSSFTGVVKDQSGAVLPGVAVEASSPVLIERSRSTVTDERGAYKIIDLRPGNYSLTFTLPGFASVKREVELPSNFTATINADMTVGGLEESITVAAESPVVDSQTNFKAQVLPREVLDSVPTAHTIQSAGQLVVGVQMDAPDVGGSRAMQQTYFFVHGAGTSQTSVLMDGMIINGLQADGAVQSYMNDAGAEQMVFQTGGGTADSPTGGLKLNVAPKEGGNSLHGSLFAGFESASLQSDNRSPFLASHGVQTVDKIGTYRDIDVTLGGPIKKDKLWLFGS